MILADYDIRVLEKLSEENKNIYKIHKAIVEDEGKIPYSTIQRATVRLEKKGLIKLTGIKKRKGPLPEKEYEISLIGMTELYLAKRKKSKNSPLDFHHSEEAQEIVENIIKYFFKGGKDRDKKKENLLVRTLRISPTLIKLLPTLGDLMKPHVIRKNPHLFKEVFGHFVGLPEIDIIFEHRDEEKMHMDFIREEFPLKILAGDFERHPDDGEIKRLFSYALMRKYRFLGNELNKEKRKVFDTVLKAVQENIVDPKGSTDEEWEKFKEFVIVGEGGLWDGEECWEHLYLYLPPGSDPHLLCDGKCSAPCHK